MGSSGGCLLCVCVFFSLLRHTRALVTFQIFLDRLLYFAWLVLVLNHLSSMHCSLLTPFFDLSSFCTSFDGLRKPLENSFHSSVLCKTKICPPSLVHWFCGNYLGVPLLYSSIGGWRGQNILELFLSHECSL